MFTKEMVESIIEDCRLRAKLFREENEGHNFGGSFVRISTVGIDGGGLSTYGKSTAIGKDDHYECHDGYLYIHSKGEHYDYERHGRVLTESVEFIAYESIIAIECSVSASV